MDQLAAVISVDSTKIRILHSYILLDIRFRLVSSRSILEARVNMNENKTKKQKHVQWIMNSQFLNSQITVKSFSLSIHVESLKNLIEKITYSHR